MSNYRFDFKKYKVFFLTEGDITSSFLRSSDIVSVTHYYTLYFIFASRFMTGFVSFGNKRNYEDFKRNVPEIIQPLFDKLIKVSKFPLFNSNCLFKSLIEHKFNIWSLKQ